MKGELFLTILVFILTASSPVDSFWGKKSSKEKTPTLNSTRLERKTSTTTMKLEDTRVSESSNERRTTIPMVLVDEATLASGRSNERGAALSAESGNGGRQRGLGQVHQQASESSDRGPKKNLQSEMDGVLIARMPSLRANNFNTSDTTTKTKKTETTSVKTEQVVIITKRTEDTAWMLEWWEIVLIGVGCIIGLGVFCVCCCAIFESNNVQRQGTELRGPDGERIGFMQAPGRHVILIIDNGLSRCRRGNANNTAAGAAADQIPTVITPVQPINHAPVVTIDKA